MKEFIGILFDWIFKAMTFLILFAFSFLLFEIGAIPGYKQQVSYVLERSGGFTPEAISDLNEMSENNFGSKFSVRPNSTGDVDFGDTIDYLIDAKIKVRGLPLPDLEISDIPGKAISKIRAGDAE